ncbi:MAG: acyl-CoA dehydrogenase family protein [Chloroflexi bacterium]|nr:acyl-CoA dehydrogenase family protein [Chloroflexota bacterium]
MPDSTTTPDADHTESSLAAARRIQSLAREHADQSERQRQLARPVVDAIAGAGLFNLVVSRSLGGTDALAPEFMEAVEIISVADGSAGWCLMVGAVGNGMAGAWLAVPAGRELFGADPQVVIASSITSGGRAQACPGGYRVSGRWRFASGVGHSAWIVSDCTIWDGEEQRKDAQGRPLVLMMLLPRAQCEVIDVWDVLGLCGTGSNDFAAEDVFVPSEHSFDLLGAPPAAPSRAYRMPLGCVLAPANAAVALGIARGAIDTVLPIIARKTSFLAPTPLRADPRVQMQLAEAEGRLRAARAFFFETIDTAQQAAAGGGAVTQRDAALVHLASVHAGRRSAEVVDIAYTLAGTSAIARGSPLERAFRDVHVVTQHLSLTDRLQQDAGRVLLGLEPQEPFF